MTMTTAHSQWGHVAAPNFALLSAADWAATAAPTAAATTQRMKGAMLIGRHHASSEAR